MDNLLTLIDSRIAQTDRNSSSIKSIPCRVEEVLDNNYVRVKMITTGAIYDLLNKSGTAVTVGETAQVYYTGLFNSKSAYVGAVTNKDSGGGNETPLSLVVGETQLIEIFDSEMVVGTCDFAVKANTVCIIQFNITLWGVNGGNTHFAFALDNNVIYEPILTTHVGEYISQSFSIPLEIITGTHTLEIKAIGDGLVSNASVMVYGHGVESADHPYEPTADADYIYETSASQTNTIYYIGDSLYPSIPEVINGQPVKILRGTTFNQSNIKSAYIPEGVEEIE